MVGKFATFVTKPVLEEAPGRTQFERVSVSTRFADRFCDKCGEFSNHLLNSLRTIGPPGGSGRPSRSLFVLVFDPKCPPGAS